jgi:hypothetical protein
MEIDRLKLLTPPIVPIKTLITPHSQRLRWAAIKDPSVHDRQAPIPLTDRQIRHGYSSHGNLLQRLANLLNRLQPDRRLMPLLDGLKCHLFITIF